MHLKITDIFYGQHNKVAMLADIAFASKFYLGIFLIHYELYQ